MAKNPADHLTKRVEKNIYQRGLYSYQVKMMVHDHKISETFDDLPSAREFRDRKRLEASTDPQLKQTYETRINKSVSRSYLVDHALDRYLTEVTPLKKGWKCETLKIGKLKRCAISQRSFYNVNAQDIKGMLAEVSTTGAKSGNAQRKYGLILSHLYNVARKEWGMKVENPVMNVQLPSNGKARDRRYERGEEHRVLRECQKSGNPWLAKSAMLSVATACRQGELFKLEWERIDLDRRVALLLDTKNGEDRETPLSPTAIKILLELAVMCAHGSVAPHSRRLSGLAATLQLDSSKLAKLEWKDVKLDAFSEAGREVLYDLAVNSASGLIFRTTQIAIAQAFKKSVRRARQKYEAACARVQIKPDAKFLKDLRLHDLRHEATSRLFEMGVFVDREVMKITGHKTSSMLARYTHLRAENLAEKMAMAEAKTKEK